MHETSRAGGEDHGIVVTDADVDAVLSEFGGDARAALAALVHDLAVLAVDYEADVSRGFVRGGMPRCRRRG